MYNNDLKNQRQIMKNRGRKDMAQIQGTTTLEGIQKGKKQVHHNDKMQKKRHHIHNQISSTTGNSKKL